MRCFVNSFVFLIVKFNDFNTLIYASNTRLQTKISKFNTARGSVLNFLFLVCKLALIKPGNALQECCNPYLHTQIIQPKRLLIDDVFQFRKTIESKRSMIYRRDQTKCSPNIDVSSTQLGIQIVLCHKPSTNQWTAVALMT